MDYHDLTALATGGAGLVMLLLAWMIGVGGYTRFITGYRRHPERYPDVNRLTRWIGFTLAAGGLSMGLAALSFAMDTISRRELGVWTVATSIVTAVLAAAAGGRGSQGCTRNKKG
jgi:Kef-type K+ transport system membrane component KefB